MTCRAVGLGCSGWPWSFCALVAPPRHELSDPAADPPPVSNSTADLVVDASPSPLPHHPLVVTPPADLRRSSAGPPVPAQLHVEPGNVVNVGWVNDNVTLRLVAVGGDVAWTASTAGAEWLAVERTSGTARDGVAEPVAVRVDRSRLRQLLGQRPTIGHDDPFEGTLTIKTPQRELTVTITGREATHAVRHCPPGGQIALDLAGVKEGFAVRAGPAQCVHWYLVAAPAWLSLDVEQPNIRTGSPLVRSLLVDAERRQRPFTTAAGAGSVIESASGLAAPVRADVRHHDDR